MEKKFKMSGRNIIEIKHFHSSSNPEDYQFTAELFAKLYADLKDELGREPTASDLDRCLYLPSSRQLQRYFKEGVVGFRKFIGAENFDLTKGSGRSKQMLRIFNESKEYEAKIFMEIYNKLNRGNEVIVMREYCYQQWFDENRLRFFHGNFSDVAIITGDHVQLFDFTCPATVESLEGCVRIKLNKLKKQPIAFRPEVTHEVYFVCVNPDISQEMIDKIPACNKEVIVYSIDTFRSKFL